MKNLRDHKDWVQPHSKEWYAQLGRMSGRYHYSWNSTIAEPNGERVFTEEVSRMVPGKKVLDIGCGHGEYTRQWSPVVRRIVGLDMTRDFIQDGDDDRSNISFVTANTKETMPFADGDFDCAYSRRGPTSAYLTARRILKHGGQFLGLHPGDSCYAELSEWFPGLFEPVKQDTPVLDIVRKRLDEGGWKDAEVKVVRGIETLHEPMDIIRMSCFGQTASVAEAAVEVAMAEIIRIFEQHRTEMGLPTTFERYMVRAWA